MDHIHGGSRYSDRSMQQEMDTFGIMDVYIVPVCV
jgi:hypothetical protein